jgi:hypothetical protein
MSRRLITLISALLVFISCAPLSGGAQNNPYVAWGEAQISDLRRQMHAVMTADEVALDRTIRYRVIDTGELNALAAKTPSGGEIRLATGLIEVIDYYSTIETVGVLWNRPECIEAYHTYVVTTAYANSTAIAVGGSASGLELPFVFMKNNSDVCPNVRPEVVTNNVNGVDNIRSTAILQSLKFVLWHEFAHELYGDFSKVSLEESRRRESRADDYAFRHMLMSPNDNPLAALSVLLLFTELESASTNKGASDHPSGIERMKAMISDTKGTSQWQNAWKSASPEQRQSMQAALDLLSQSNE